MGYAKHVGRVGALAVALGIGTAVITTPGIAWADDETTTHVDNTDSVNETPDNPTNDTPAAPQAPDTHVGNPDPTPGSGITTPPLTGSGSGTSIGAVRGPEVTLNVQTITTEDQPAVKTPDLPTPVDPVVVTPSAPQTPLPPIVDPLITTPDPTLVDDDKLVLDTLGTAGTPVINKDLPGTVVLQSLVTTTGVPPGQDTVGRSSLRTLVAQNIDTGTSNPMQNNNIVAALVAPVPSPPPVPQPTLFETVIAIPGAIISTALNLITQALAPLIGPGAPVDNPVLWAVLAFVRRQFNASFANSTPVLAPQQTSLGVGGPIQGTFGATDVDGDTLTYAVPTTGLGAPANGTVTINQAAGTWTYTPAAGYVGQDYFFVTATDATGAPHIHALGQTHQAAARVDVTVASTTNAAPVISNISAPGTPDANGVVRGSFLVTDANLDDIGVGLADDGQPQNGSVTFVVNRTTGLVTYTYTPTQAARLTAGLDAAPQTFARSSFAAAAASAPTSDTFTVAVSDGQLSTPVTVTVPIAPARLSVSATRIALGDSPFDIAISPDGKRIYITNQGDGTSGSVSVIDTTTNTVVGNPISLPGPYVGSPPYGLVVSPDGNRLYVVDTAVSGVTVIDTVNRVIVDRIEIQGTLTDVAVSSDGKRLFVTNDYVTRILDVATHQTLAEVGTRGQGIFIVMSPDGSRAYVAQGAIADTDVTGVAVIDTTTNSLVGNPIALSVTDFTHLPYNIAVSPDGRSIYVTDVNVNTVTVVDTSTRTVVGQPIAVGTYPAGIAVSPDGSLVAVVNGGDGTLSIIDTKTNAVIGAPVVIGSEYSAQSVVFAKDGTHAYVVTNDGLVVVNVVPAPATTPVIGTPTVVGTPNPSTGATTVTVKVAAGPNGTVPTGFTVTQPTGVNGTIATAANPIYNAADGTYTYTVTYTPDPQDRVDAFSTPGTDQVALTVSVNNGSGTVATRNVPITIDPVAVAVIGSGSLATVPGGTTRVADDGTLTQTVTTGSGTEADPFRTTLTVLRPGQTPVSATATGRIVGNTQNNPQVGADGTSVLTTFVGSGSSADPYRTTVTVLRSGQATTSTTAVGNASGDAAVVGPDGTVAFKTQTGTGSTTDPYKTTLVVIRPREEAVSTTFVGLPRAPIVGADGTVALTTGTGSGSTLDPYLTTVTVLRAGEPLASAAISGTSIDAAVVGADGTVVQTTIAGSGPTTYQTTVTVLRIGQEPVSTTTTGLPLVFTPSSRPVVGADGTVAQITSNVLYSPSSAAVTTVTVSRPGEIPVSTTVVGQPTRLTAVGADGTVALTTFAVESGTGRPVTTVTVLRVGQEPASATVTGNPTVGSEIVGAGVGADGTVAQTTTLGSGSSTQTTVTVLRAGQAPVSAVIDGQPTAANRVSFGPAVVGADGTVAQTTFTGSGSTAQTTLTVFRAGQTPTMTTVTGSPFQAPVVAADGTVAQTTSNGSGSTDQTTVTVSRNGQTPLSTTVTGRQFGTVLVSADGTVALVTLTGSGATAQTTVTVLQRGRTPETVIVPGTPERVAFDNGTRLNLVTRTAAAVALTQIAIAAPPPSASMLAV